MPRRREFQGVANNLTQWVLSRNFDWQGYWALGMLYKFAEEHGISSLSLELEVKDIVLETMTEELMEVVSQLTQFVYRSMHSKKMPEEWLERASVTFSFNVPYQRQYHYWGSKLGQPCLCRVDLQTDIGSLYTSENGCNCWIHDPNREHRRSCS